MPVRRDQLRVHRSVTTMGELYLNDGTGVLLIVNDNVVVGKQVGTLKRNTAKKFSVLEG